MAKTCGGFFWVLCRRTWFREENWERKTVIALLYIYGQSFLNVTVALTLRQSELQCCAPSYAKVFVYSSVRRKTRNNILLSTRGRRSCYSRPKVALLAADGSITRGREQHEWRPRVDKFLKSFRADILFYPCEVMRWPWGAETTAHRPMFTDKHRDRGTKSAMCLLFAGSGDKKQALWQFV